MSRFIIRNYGPPQQIPYKGQQITLLRDGVLETDDASLALVLRAVSDMYVTDRGQEFTSRSASKAESTEAKQEAAQDSEGLSYEEMTLKELRALAKDRSIDSSKSKKAELIRALQLYDADDAES